MRRCFFSSPNPLPEGIGAYGSEASTVPDVQPSRNCQEHLAELHDDAFTFARWQERSKKRKVWGGGCCVSHVILTGV